MHSNTRLVCPVFPFDFFQISYGMFVGRSPLPPEDLNTKPAYSLYILGYPAEDYAIIYHFSY